MNVIDIDSLDDPRVQFYRDLRDRELRRQGDRFMGEGQKTVQRMIETGVVPESILITDRRLPEIAAILPPQVPIYRVADSLMTAIAGFQIHTGILAVAHRPPDTSPEVMLANAARTGQLPTLVICPQIKETANLGAIIRIAAGFGVAGLIVGPMSCDPYFRRSVRVSMGEVFKLPIYHSTDIAADLLRLRINMNVELIATVLSPDAQPLTEAHRSHRPIALLLGHEVDGLPTELTNLCHRKLTIPMQSGVDSLNVSMSAAVFLYHFSQPHILPA